MSTCHVGLPEGTPIFSDTSVWCIIQRGYPQAQIAPVAAQQVARVLQKHGERFGGPAALDVSMVIPRWERYPGISLGRRTNWPELLWGILWLSHSNFTCTIWTVELQLHVYTCIYMCIYIYVYIHSCMCIQYYVVHRHIDQKFVQGMLSATMPFTGINADPPWWQWRYQQKAGDIAI